MRRLSGALFVAAGGYHHHVGLNTWAGQAVPAPPLGSLGLRTFTIVLPDGAARERAVAAATEAGLEVLDDAGRAVVTDPSGNRAVLAVA